MAKGGRLEPSDWCMAALRSIAAGGAESVSVEGLARELGVTKGSFYWHFADREALIAAAVAYWEERGTAEVIDRFASVADPRERLKRLLDFVLADDEVGRLDVVLAVASDDPAIGEAVSRVTRARVGFIAKAYRELGLAQGEAQVAAEIAYATYLGSMQLQRLLPRTGAAYRRLTRQLMVTLVDGQQKPSR